MEAGSQRIHQRLPIFALRAGRKAILYAPGHVASLHGAEAAMVEEFFAGRGPLPDHLTELVHDLAERATEAEAKWLALGERPFVPECLTVYLSNHCNLGCVYCYAADPDGRRNAGWAEKELPLVHPDAVEAAARIVAANCARKEKPFHLVLHGGGEPTLHWSLLVEIVERVRAVAAAFALEVDSYISTSGVLTEEKARWLGNNITRISLSIDGPAPVQDQQRPLSNGRSTWPSVERTARILREMGVAFSIRTTITRATLRRQAEILISLRAQLGAREFNFEPAYHPHDNAGWSLVDLQDAETFAEHFLAAQYIAELLGCELQTSGVRLDEIHGPFCNVLRDVLQVVPDNTATSCFVCTDSTQLKFAEHRVGRWDPAANDFRIDNEGVAALRRRALAIPDRCRSCHNIYHCARDCPDVCPIPGEPQREAPPGFRCEVQRRLGQAWILDAVQDPIEKLDLESGEIEKLVRHLTELSFGVSAFAVTKEWLAARRHYRLHPRRAPDPIWAVRGFELDGAAAWAEISGPIAARMESSPISIYIHIPFCDRKCEFCDCYSLTVKEGVNDQRRREYMQALLAEINAWAAIAPLTRRAVTTVHLGGGTPGFLEHGALRALVEALSVNFNITSETEWAIESTTTQLTTAGLQELVELGFTRLHVGVQTLEEPARRIAGRKEPAAVVEEKLRAALTLGMIVTVDIIYGLPGETVAGFVNTLERLAALGVHGFSLYKLNLTPHNQPFGRQHRLDATDRSELFFMFQLGELLLRSKGYRKSHFAHFSKPEDHYLYYTHTRRGEDLLALGATADGTFGDFNYRHPEFSEYTRMCKAPFPILAGATYESPSETRLHSVTAGLMTAALPVQEMAQLGVKGLAEKWIAAGLLRIEPSAEELQLTASGSWLISEMLEELNAAMDINGSFA